MRSSLHARLRQRETGGRSLAGPASACLLASIKLTAATYERGPPTSCGLLCLALEPANEALLLAGGADGSLTLYDTAHAQPAAQPVPAKLRLRRGAAHAFSTTAAGWYPDGGGLFFSCSLDGFAKGFDAASDGAEVLRFGNGPGAARDRLLSLALPRSARASHGLLAAGAADGRCLLYDPLAGGGAHELRGHTDAVLALCWLPGHEHLLASGGADGQLRLWDVRTCGTLYCFDQHGGGGGGGRPTAHSGPLLAMEASPDGRLLYTHGADGRLRRWDVAAGKNTLVHFSLTDVDGGGGGGGGGGLSAPPPPPRSATPSGSTRLAGSLCVSGCGAFLFAPLLPHSSRHSGGTSVFCERTGRRLHSLAGGHHGGPVRALALRRAGTELFSAGADGEVRFWSGAPQPQRCAVEERGRGTGGEGGGWRDDVDEWDVSDEEGRGPRMAYRVTFTRESAEDDR